MLDFKQIAGGEQLVNDVTALKTGIYAHKVVVGDRQDLNTALTELVRAVNTIVGKTSRITQQSDEGGHQGT